MLCKKPFPVGTLTACDLMACLPTPPPPSHPWRTLESLTDASWVRPPEVPIPLVQDAAWHGTVPNSPGASNGRPGPRTIHRSNRKPPFPFFILFLSHASGNFMCLFPLLLDCGLPDSLPNNQCTWPFRAPGDSKGLLLTEAAESHLTWNLGAVVNAYGTK